MKYALLTAVATSTLLLAACNQTASPTNPAAINETADSQTSQASETKVLTVQDAREFLQRAEKEMEEVYEYSSRVAWVKANFITEDTNWLEQRASEDYTTMAVRLANEAKKFNDLNLPADMRRKMEFLKRGITLPAPTRPGAANELAKITTDLDSAYSTGTFVYNGEELSLGQLSEIMATSRDPQELSAVWAGWRTVSPPMKTKYARMVDIANEGAVELGFDDVGALWRSGYDMGPDEFAEEADRLWTQVSPLYEQLHCHVRYQLNEEYGDDVVPLDQPIRADLLGNMWAQSWGNISEIVMPVGDSGGYDLNQLLVDADYDALKMVKTGENFFTSLGFAPLPQTFWDRSLITEPRDRDVVCHASAWNLDDKDDIRIKMCTKVNAEDFETVHHELGHNFYQRAYNKQPIFYKTGANDGFHEAIGDMIALSITPEYLVEIDLLDPEAVPGEEEDIKLLMDRALNKVAFLPFGLLVDKWRWQVFSGELSPEEYNSGWWALREEYQGIRPPVERGPNAFDPGAKYHIPGNTPYMRYFLAHILQFQFHQAACEQAGWEGPLHRCSIYGNREVGQRFNAMMEMGASKPWPDALEAFTGSREMDGAAMLAYFEPLMEYLEEENADRDCGW